MFTFEIISFASFVVFFIISAIFSVGATTEIKFYWFISIFLFPIRTVNPKSPNNQKPIFFYFYTHFLLSLYIPVFSTALVLQISDIPWPFLRPMGSLLSLTPPWGTHLSAHSSFSFSSSTCSSVRPCMLGGSVIPCSANSSISVKIKQ